MTMKNVKLDSELVKLFLKKLQEQGTLEGIPSGCTLNQALQWMTDNWNTKIGILGDGHVTAEDFQELKEALEQKTKELEELRTKYDDHKAMHERWKDNQPALVKEKVAEINRQATEVSANAKIEVAKIQGTSSMASAAMSAAAKEGKFVDTFGDTIKDMMPSIFPANKPQLKEGERAER